MIEVAVKVEMTVSPKFVRPETYNRVEVRAVEVTLVKTAVLGPVTPIGVLLMEPPSMVRPLTTIASVTELAGKDRVLVTVKLPMVAIGMTPEAAKKLVLVRLTVKILLGLKLPAVKLSAVKFWK